MKLFQQAMQSLPAFEEIQSTGMPASKSYFESLYTNFTSRMRDITDQLSTIYYDDKPINPKSPTDSAAFIAHLGLSTSGITESGALSTAKDSIEHLRYLDGDAGKAMSLFFNWREIQHRRDSFCTPILDAMTRRNLHPGTSDTYNIMGDLKITRTTSRRPSMTKGHGINLLNLPSRQGVGMVEGLNKLIRAGFVTPLNEIFVANDESQIELRLLAHFSQDELMLDIYHNGGDIHAITCQAIFGLPPDQQDPYKHRAPSKNVNFMTGYGGGAHKLWTMLRQMNITEYNQQDCQRFLDTFYNTYPGVQVWKDKVIWHAKRNGGYVSTYAGMRRYLPNLWSKDNGIRNKAEREAINHIIQGTAQDIIQRAMGWIYKQMVELRRKGHNVWLALQLYDELIHRCEVGIADKVNEIVLEGLTRHHGMNDIRVPIKADSSIGNCWGSL